jgi:predicted HTH transcriptional regulator
MRAAITRQVIEALVSDGVCESRQLDYKRDWVGRTDNDKKEFLADVVAFANTMGGMMLFGIDEERDCDGKQTGAPREAIGVEIASADEEIRRITDIIRTGIAPRLPDVAISLADGFPGGPVIAIHIPRSHRSPHMVSFKSSPKFFARVDRSRYALDIDELRDAFLRAEAMPARIRDFRSHRIRAIDSGDTPVPMDAGPLVVL